MTPARPGQDRGMAKVNPIELQKALKGMSYPATRDEVVEQARSNGASDEIVSAIESAGKDRFESPAEVSGAVSGG